MLSHRRVIAPTRFANFLPMPRNCHTRGPNEEVAYGIRIHAFTWLQILYLGLSFSSSIVFSSSGSDGQQGKHMRTNAALTSPSPKSHTSIITDNRILSKYMFSSPKCTLKMSINKPTAQIMLPIITGRTFSRGKSFLSWHLILSKTTISISAAISNSRAKQTLTILRAR